MTRKLCSFLLACLVMFFSANAAVAEGEVGPESFRQKQWVDSVFRSLTPNQRLGQLFMVAAFSNKDQRHIDNIDRLVKEYYIGGLMFMQGGPYRQAVLTNRYQAETKVPLLIAMDAEWGLNMRLDSSMHFAKQMTFGAIEDHKYAYVLGREMALKIKRLGVNVSFSPVVDVNNNPKNPVIGIRSFGENKEEVAMRPVSLRGRAAGQRHHCRCQALSRPWRYRRRFALCPAHYYQRL